MRLSTLPPGQQRRGRYGWEVSYQFVRTATAGALAPLVARSDGRLGIAGAFTGDLRRRLKEDAETADRGRGKSEGRNVDLQSLSDDRVLNGMAADVGVF